MFRFLGFRVEGLVFSVYCLGFRVYMPFMNIARDINADDLFV